METLNSAFFFVTDKIISLQAFFMNEAWAIGRYVLLIALSLAAVNYAISGQGFKESIVKIGKASVFFFLVMQLYPRIIGRITEWTFEKAYQSTFSDIQRDIMERRAAVGAQALDAWEKYQWALEYRDNVHDGSSGSSWGSEYETNLADADLIIRLYERENGKNGGSPVLDPLDYFSKIVVTREYVTDYGSVQYTVVAPAACFELILLIAGSCTDYADKSGLNFSKALKGLLCGFAVLFTGIFAVIEYLMAYIEFLLVTSVGIILFPLSLWDGSKFLSEKLIGAITGFFIKLLFCNICIFLLLWGYMSICSALAKDPFAGQVEQMLIILFTSLLFFYICKSAPALAQSLLSGTPSLSAAGAIGAAAGAIGAGAKMIGMANKAGGGLVQGAAKTAFAGAGMLSQAKGAAGAVKSLGGSGKEQAAAAFSSMGSSAKEGFVSGAGNLARSLLSGGKGSGAGGGGPNGRIINMHDNLQRHLASTVTEAGGQERRQTLGENMKNRRDAGTEAGKKFHEKNAGGDRKGA